MKPTKKTALVAARALVVADEAPLDGAQRKVLAEALRRAEDTRNVMEDALVAFGRWLLVQVFDDDAGAALAGRHHNPVWRSLLARAGGPTLRLSERMLYVAIHIAAHDKRITDEAWRNLEPGRKELLLPLGDEAAMRGYMISGAHKVAMPKLMEWCDTWPRPRESHPADVGRYCPWPSPARGPKPKRSRTARRNRSRSSGV